MEVQKWEAWYSYIYHFLNPHVDVDELARKLVVYGLAPMTSLRRGTVYASTSEGVTTGKMTLPVRSMNSFEEVQFDLDIEEPLSPRMERSTKALSSLRVAERRLFSTQEASFEDTYLLQPPNVKAVLDPIVMMGEEEDNHTVLTPYLTVFEDGVVILKFRLTGGDNELSLTRFVDEVVNLPRHGFLTSVVNKEVARLASHAYSLYQRDDQGLYGRYAELDEIATHNEVIDQDAIEVEIEDWPGSRELFPLSFFTPLEKLSSVATTLSSIVGYFGSVTRDGYDYVLRGHGSKMRLGSHWRGYPTFYLIEFSGQKGTASANEATWGDEFDQIINQTVNGIQGNALLNSCRDLRVFEDFTSYVSSAATLHAWSKKGLGQLMYDDPFSCHGIHESEIKGEMLSYVYSVHRKIYDLTYNSDEYRETVSLQSWLLGVKREMEELSPYGEIQEYMQSGWQALGVHELRDEIKSTLEILESLQKAERSSERDWVRIALSVILVLLAYPAFSNSVVQPLWKYSGWDIPKSDHLLTLISSAVSFVIVLGIACIVWLVLSKKDV